VKEGKRKEKCKYKLVMKVEIIVEERRQGKGKECKNISPGDMRMRVEW
jgi:hypothetical protein